MVALVSAYEGDERYHHRAFTLRVMPCGHIEVVATDTPVTVADIEAQAADLEAQIVVAVSTYRYISQVDQGVRRAQVRRLNLDGSVGPVLWRYSSGPGEEARIWRARVRDPEGLREQLLVEVTMAAAGCPVMLERVELELVALEDSNCRLQL